MDGNFHTYIMRVSAVNTMKPRKMADILHKIPTHIYLYEIILIQMSL